MVTRVLAIIGTVLVWLVVLSPAALSALQLLAGRRFLFDYLMPAELCPVALIGGGLLLWAAWRAHSRRKVIGWGLAISAGSLVTCLAVASVTGLASGDIEPTGWQWALASAFLGLYVLALVGVGVGGVLLLRDLLRARA
jgi:hypothetical protein